MSLDSGNRHLCMLILHLYFCSLYYLSELGFKYFELCFLLLVERTLCIWAKAEDYDRQTQGGMAQQCVLRDIKLNLMIEKLLEMELGKEPLYPKSTGSCSGIPSRKGLGLNQFLKIVLNKGQ